MIGLFCRIASLLQVSFAKENYNFIDPTNRSHPVVLSNCVSSMGLFGNTLQHAATHCNTLQHTATCKACVALHSGALVPKKPIHIELCCSCCSVLQCVAVRCNVSCTREPHGVATVSRIDEITGLFDRISSVL